MRFAETLQELEESPEKFGMPTFEEFRRNKERYMGRYDDEVASVDAGDKATGAIQKYYLSDVSGHYRCETLEYAERIALDMGLNLHQDFKIDPQYKDDDGIYIEVTFRSKRSLARRDSW